MENCYGSILTNYYIRTKASFITSVTALPRQMFAIPRILNCFSNYNLHHLKTAIARKALCYELTNLSKRGQRQIKISKSRVKLRASYVKQPLLCWLVSELTPRPSLVSVRPTGLTYSLTHTHAGQLFLLTNLRKMVQHLLVKTCAGDTHTHTPLLPDWILLIICSGSFEF